MATEDSIPTGGVSQADDQFADLDAQLAAAKPGALATGASAAYHGTLADLASAAAGTFGAFGMKGAHEWAAQKAQEHAEKTPQTISFEEAQKTGRYGEYALSQIGQLGANVAMFAPLMFAGGMGATALAARAGIGMVRGAAGKMVMKEGVQKAAGFAGQVGGVFPALYAQNVGADYRAAKEAGIDDIESAARTGLPKAILNAIVPGTFSGLMMRPGAEAAKRTVADIVGRVLGTSALGATELGGVGWANTKLTQMERAERDPSYDINSPEAQAERKEATISGVVGGGIGLGVAGGLHEFRKAPEAKPFTGNEPMERTATGALEEGQPKPPQPSGVEGIGPEQYAEVGAALEEAAANKATNLEDLNKILPGIHNLREYEFNNTVGFMRRLEELDAEVPKSQGGERPMAVILKEKKEIAAALEDIQQNPPSAKLFARVKQLQEKLGFKPEKAKPIAEAVLSTDEQEATNAARSGNFTRINWEQYQDREGGGQAAEASRSDSAIRSEKARGAYPAAETGDEAPRRSTEEILNARRIVANAMGAKVQERRLLLEGPPEMKALPSPEEQKLLTEKVAPERKQQFLDVGAATTEEHVDSMVAGGLLKPNQAKVAKRIIGNAFKEALESGSKDKAKDIIGEGITRALKGKVDKADVEAIVDDFYKRFVGNVIALPDLGINLPKEVIGTTRARWLEGQEYEGRLFKGAYDYSRLKTAAKDAPIHKMIAQGRERYNAIRKELGLSPVTDWTKRPDDLVQRQPAPEEGIPVAVPSGQKMLFSKASVTSPTGMIYVSHWGDVRSGMTNPKMIGTGVKGADQEPARTIGVAYTSGVVRGAHYIEPEVQGKPQSVAIIPADRVYEARSDDPMLAAAFAKIKDRYGPDQSLGWMQYLKDIHDLGKYDAVLYGGGQVRMLTPQRVYAEYTVKDALTKAKRIADQHNELGGWVNENLVTGEDMRGTHTFSVSLYKGREEMVPGERLTEDQVAEYTMRHDDLLSLPDHSIGTWKDGGDTYFDVVVNVPRMDVALKLGRDNEQRAIGDNRAGVPIPVGHSVFDSAQVYNRENGLPVIVPLNYIEVPEMLMRKMALGYERLLKFNPAEHVKAAYDQFLAEVRAQYEALSKTIKVEPWTKSGEQPYADSAAMRADVFGNNHLYISDVGLKDHPYITPEDNFRLRAIHDIYGHAKTGFEFGPRGELNAFRAHTQMFSEMAKPALASETIAQTGYLNHHPSNADKLLKDRTFSEQKFDLLPDELWRPLIEGVQHSRAAQLAAVDSVFTEKGASMLDRWDEIFGKREGVSVSLFVKGEKGGVIGGWDGAKRIAWMAVNADNALGLVNHEGYHALKDMVLDKHERAIIANELKPGEVLHDRLLEFAEKYDKANETDISSEIRGDQNEAEAYGFQFWKDGHLEASTTLGKVWDKIRGYITSVANLVRGHGLRNAQDIFHAIDKGAYARRENRGFIEGSPEHFYLNAIEPDVFPGLMSRAQRSGPPEGAPWEVVRDGSARALRGKLQRMFNIGIKNPAAKFWFEAGADATQQFVPRTWPGLEKKLKRDPVDLFHKILAITSVGMDVPTNFRESIEAVNQIAQGLDDIQAGLYQKTTGPQFKRLLADQNYEPGMRVDKKGNVIYENSMEKATGPKILAFYQTLDMARDLISDQPRGVHNLVDAYAVLDRHMSRIFGFDNTFEGSMGLKERIYAWAELHHLAKQNGVNVWQAQAAIWVEFKARMDGTQRGVDAWAKQKKLIQEYPVKAFVLRGRLKKLSISGEMRLSESYREEAVQMWNNEMNISPALEKAMKKAGIDEHELTFQNKLTKENLRKYMVEWRERAFKYTPTALERKEASYHYGDAARQYEESFSHPDPDMRGTIAGPKAYRNWSWDMVDGEPTVDTGLVAEGAPPSTKTYYSMAALHENEINAIEGRNVEKQMMMSAVDVFEQAHVAKDLEKKIIGERVRGTAGQFIEGFKHLANELMSGRQVSRQSEGHNNVFEILTNFRQRAARIASQSVDGTLATWRARTTAYADWDMASKALIEMSSGDFDNQQGFTAGSAGHTAAINGLTAKQLEMFNQAHTMISDLLVQDFQGEKFSYAKTLGADSAAYKEWESNRKTQVQQLIDNYYFPARRYGDHAVYMNVVKDGKPLTIGWEQFESRGEAAQFEAQLRKQLGDEHPDMDVGYAYKYKAEHDGTISFKQFLDMARKQGVVLTQVEKEKLGKAMIAADSTMRNRMFRRKGVAGQSENGMRVLAEFATTMAHKIAYSEVGDAVQDALHGVKVDSKFKPDGTLEINSYAGTNLWKDGGELAGYYRNRADELVDFVTTPRQQSSTVSFLRGAAAFNMLGASIASGFVNSLSLPMISVPYFTAHTTYTDAIARTFGGIKWAGKNWGDLTDISKLQDLSHVIEGAEDPAFRQALIVGALSDKLLDTEMYQIVGLTRGGVLAQSKTAQAAMTKWMFPFRYAEQINRFATFKAAWEIGKNAKNLEGEALQKFAFEAVDATQFRYDPVNRPAFSRTPVGAVLMIFKTWPIYYLETMYNLAKVDKGAAGIMLAHLAVISGIEGLPFAQDIENIIDTVGQRIFGAPWNTGRTMRNAAKDLSEMLTGADFSGALMHGAANEFTSASIAARQSMGNLIPGSDIGLANADYKQVAQGIFGPAGSMVYGWAQGADHLSKGEFNESIKKAAPLMVQNLAKSWEQFQSGYAKDIAGRKLADVGTLQPILQAMGFSSSAVSNAYEVDRIDQQQTAFYKQAERDFSKHIVQGIISGNTETVQGAVDAVAAWNTNHPDMPMKISPASIRKQVQLAGLPINERTLRRMPKQLRASSASFEVLYGDGR